MRKIIRGAGHSLEWLGDEIQRKIDEKVEAHTEWAANLIADDARTNCPTGKTGKLKASIRVNKSIFEIGRIVAVGNKAAYYAAFVELGTKRQEKQAFMRRALKDNEGKILDRVRSKGVL